MDNEYYDTKFIGIYSSRYNALCAIEKFSKLPGFCDFKTGFHIETVKVKLNYRKLKKGIVYLLTVTKALDKDEITILYFVCSNIIFAMFLWIVKSITLFAKHQKIYVEKYNVNKDNWTEGFVTI